jgi:hypothetical protein
VQESYINDFNSLNAFLGKNKKFFLVIDPKELNNTTSVYNLNCSFIGRQKKHGAYLCLKQ